MTDTPRIPEPCDLLIEAGYVVPIEPHAVVLEDHAVAVRGSEIIAILPRAEARERFAPKQTVSLSVAVTCNKPIVGKSVPFFPF